MTTMIRSTVASRSGRKDFAGWLKMVTGDWLCSCWCWWAELAVVEPTAEAVVVVVVVKAAWVTTLCSLLKLLLVACVLAARGDELDGCWVG